MMRDYDAWACSGSRHECRGCGGSYYDSDGGCESCADNHREANAVMQATVRTLITGWGWTPDGEVPDLEYDSVDDDVLGESMVVGWHDTIIEHLSDWFCQYDDADEQVHAALLLTRAHMEVLRLRGKARSDTTVTEPTMLGFRVGEAGGPCAFVWAWHKNIAGGPLAMLSARLAPAARTRAVPAYTDAASVIGWTAWNYAGFTPPPLRGAR